MSQAMLSETPNERPLLLGSVTGTNRPLYYVGEPSLTTIGPFGSGKTQCHVLPNLMLWQGPALVLDVTGDLWRKTSLQRQSYGPVYRLNLEDVEASERYNPLFNIRTDPAHVWEDASLFTNQVYARTSSGDQNVSFHESAKNLLTGAAVFVAKYLDDSQKNFRSLLDIVSGDTLDRFITAASADKVRAEVPSLANLAGSLARTDPKLKSSTLWTAKSMLNAWDGYAADRLTRISDWNPDDLRRQNGTLYLCIPSDKLATHAGLVRVIVGQHIRALCRERITEETPWFQFFLDELPQLKRFDDLQFALDVGRNYRVRLWMFMQYFAQMEDAYGQKLAEGMVGACGATFIMNPGVFDGTAERVSKAIGTVDSILEPGQKPLVEPHRLAGPEFRDRIIALARSEKPRQIEKRFYHATPAFTRMEGEAP